LYSTSSKISGSSSTINIFWLVALISLTICDEIRQSNVCDG
jgi:hypothetical protein